MEPTILSSSGAQSAIETAVLVYQPLGGAPGAAPPGATPPGGMPAGIAPGMPAAGMAL